MIEIYVLREEANYSLGVKDDNWPGYYCTNDWQEISADDAKNFAEALEYMSGDNSIETGVAEELDQGNYNEDYLAARKNLIDAWSGLDAQEKTMVL